MVKIMVAEATGKVLDFLVFQAEGHSWWRPEEFFEPTVEWSQGGPIIERERITLRVSTMLGIDWVAFYDRPGEYHAHIRAKGPTSLIAAMRCYVVSKLGPEVEVPESLLP